MFTFKPLCNVTSFSVLTKSPCVVVILLLLIMAEYRIKSKEAMCICICETENCVKTSACRGQMRWKYSSTWKHCMARFCKSQTVQTNVPINVRLLLGLASRPVLYSWWSKCNFMFVEKNSQETFRSLHHKNSSASNPQRNHRIPVTIYILCNLQIQILDLTVFFLVEPNKLHEKTRKGLINNKIYLIHIN